jgi:hypothetical protein
LEQTAIFATIVCSHSGEPAVGRFAWNGSAYMLVASSKQRPGSVLPDEGKSATKIGLEIAPGYHCPYCHSTNIVSCGRCHGLGCWDPSWETFRCPRCGNQGRVSGTIDRIYGGVG